MYNRVKLVLGQLLARAHDEFADRDFWFAFAVMSVVALPVIAVLMY